MARVYSTPNSRLDDNARRLTQDYPAFGENLSRASSRSSNASNTSRSAYPRVPEDILDQIDEARSARDRALANWNSARQDPDVTQARAAELGSEYLEAQQELDRAKHQHRLFYVGRPSELSTGTTPRLAAPTPLRAVPKQLEIRLKQGEDPRNLGHRANAEVQVTDKTFARIERTCAKLSSSHVISPSRPYPPPLLAPSPLQLPVQLSLQPVPEDPVPFLEQEGHGTSVCGDEPLKITDRPNLTRSEHDHAKVLDRRVEPTWSALSPLLTASSLPTGFENSAPSREQRETSRKPVLDLDHGVHFKTGEEVGIVVGGE
ncbi:hypothetical protein K435DRAFT_877146 [Dendrothele bispora CBS 962.96]|uniref:Uncharacterized protein n=1 Tax=Dendrothele bispora (strain CBS 962.96) TaxID=1314807 RepID=A0A4S8KQL7_DENBC|nr:hypothetical protein K435DRAFT_877146 [Dendrothele bispora CBS 962.96]